MSAVVPRRNLPSNAELWGRSVDERLASVQDVVGRQGERTNNSLSALNSTVTKLGDQVLEVKTIADTLVTQQAELERVVSMIPVSSSASSERLGFVINAGTIPQTSISIPWVVGKSRCDVFATGQATFFSVGVASANIAVWNIRIGNSFGPYGAVIPLNMDGKTTSFSHTQTLEAQTSVDVSAYSVAGANHGDGSANSVNLFVMAVFS